MAYTKDEAIAVIRTFLQKIWQELPIVLDIKRTGIEIIAQSNKTSKPESEEPIK